MISKSPSNDQSNSLHTSVLDHRVMDRAVNWPEHRSIITGDDLFDKSTQSDHGIEAVTISSSEG